MNCWARVRGWAQQRDWGLSQQCVEKQFPDMKVWNLCENESDRTHKIDVMGRGELRMALEPGT